MARCAGCSSTGCTCQLQVSDTASLNLTLTGTGVAGDSWVLSGVASGTGGVPDEHIFLGNGGGDTIDSFVPYFVPWDPTILGGTAYELRGTNITWAIGNPTRITINADGVYDVNCGARVVSDAGSTPPVAILITVYLNGLQDPRPALLAQEQSIGTVSTGVMVNSTFDGWQLAAGDYLEVVLSGADVVSGSAVLLTIYAGVSVTQRL